MCPAQPPGPSGHLFSSGGAPWGHRCLFCSDSVLGGDPGGCSSGGLAAGPIQLPSQGDGVVLINSPAKVTFARVHLGAGSFQNLLLNLRSF